MIKLTAVRVFFATQRRKMYRECVKHDLWFVVQQLPDTFFQNLRDGTVVKYQKYSLLLLFCFKSGIIEREFDCIQIVFSY